MGNDTPILICDGELEIVKITEDLYGQAVEHFQKYYMKNENFCIATNLLGTQQSIDEMEILLREILKDGVSFAIKQRSTNNLVAICCNKILCPAAGLTLANITEKFISPAVVFNEQLVERLETTYDLYKEWQIDCIYNSVFSSIRPDFAGQGIAMELTQHAIDYGKKLKNGTLSVNELLPIHVRDLKPQAICALFTSNFVQRLGEKLGFETVYKVSYKDIVYDGKTFAERLDPIHEFCTFAVMRL